MTTENHPNLFLVSDQDFEQRVLHSTLPVIVDFTADSCPCRVLAPLYAQLSSTYQGKLSFAKMDTDENVLVPARLGIQSIPTLVLFIGGRPVGHVVGPHPARLPQSIERLLAEVSAEVPTGCATRPQQGAKEADIPPKEMRTDVSYQFAICRRKNGGLPCFHTITEPVFQQASTDSATHQSDCHMRLEVASTPLVPISRSFHCTRHFTAA